MITVRELATVRIRVGVRVRVEDLLNPDDDGESSGLPDCIDERRGGMTWVRVRAKVRH